MATLTLKGSANLEDLRGRLADRLAQLLILVSVFLFWFTLPLEPYPFIAVGLLITLIGAGLLVRVLVRSHLTAARHLLVWSTTIGLLAGMCLFADPWLPFLGILVALVCAMLTPGAEALTAGLIAALAAWLTHSGARSYPLPYICAVLGAGAAAAWLAMRTLYTALEWVWGLQERATELLEVARDRQGELNRTLRSLELAYNLQRRTQDELAVAHRRADEARRLKEQFAANISHELRTPLSLILGFSEVMYCSPQVYGEMDWPATLRRDVYQIYRSSRHLLEMIDDVLDLSRFEMVGFTLSKEPTPLEPLLRSVADIAQSLFRGQAVRLVVEIAPDLPALEIDRTRIRQVLLNLLSNARRFTEVGTVRLGAKVGDGEVIVSVSDTGRGIPADRLPAVFEEFYQVDSSLRRSHGGAGLGLAISKRFVQAQGGRIWAESQEGAGSTFSFALPTPGAKALVPGLSVERPVEWRPAEARPSILVVDPDPGVAALVRRHVDEYDVIHVPEPGGLAREVELHHPRAVVHNLPPGERRGEELPAALSVPMIECSLPSSEWVVEDLAVTGCLAKPVAAQQLMQKIDRLGPIRDILVVDDDRGFVQLVERLILAAGRGFAVRHAYDGKDGLAALRARRPDLLLLDLIMPGLDGFGILAEMRMEAELASIPVLILTAASYADELVAARSSHVLISRPGGLHTAETLRCLRAVMGVLEPRYGQVAAAPQV